MNIAVIGTGYVGLVQGVIMAEFGAKVICMDIDEHKIETLKEGKVPIYEPGLQELLMKNIKGKRIEFTTDMEYAVKNSEVIFIAVGTPPALDGSADLHYVLDVAANIGKYIDEYKVIVDKSTVPVGTGKKVRDNIQQELDKRGENIEFDIVSNPEFLRKIFTKLAMITPINPAIKALPRPERSFLVNLPINAIAKNIAEEVTKAAKTVACV